MRNVSGSAEGAPEDAASRSWSSKAIVKSRGSCGSAENLEGTQAGGAGAPADRPRQHHRPGRGLDLGADDHLTKPFAFEEFLVRRQIDRDRERRLLHTVRGAGYVLQVGE